MKTKLIIMSLFFLFAKYGTVHAQAGHPRDSIVRYLRSCTDCQSVTWSNEGALTHLSYSLTNTGITYDFYFDMGNICIRYEERYPSIAYMNDVAYYMDTMYTKTSSMHWTETLRTTTGQPVIDRAVYWRMEIMPDRRLLVVGELQAIKK